MKATAKTKALCALFAGVMLSATSVVSMQTLKAEEGLPSGISKVMVKPATNDGPLDEIFSGWHFRSKETKNLQKDDFENPGYLWVEQGEELWSAVDGAR